MMFTEAKCPTCMSHAPHLHPAVQYGGEVQPCKDPFHREPTTENTPERIAEMQKFFEVTA